MREEYDFRKARRGAVLETAKGKTRITIRIDDYVLDWFRQAVHEAGGGSYQTLMNDALRVYVESEEEALEETLRRVLREELPGSTQRSEPTRRKKTRMDRRRPHPRKGATKKRARSRRRDSKRKPSKKGTQKRKRA